MTDAEIEKKIDRIVKHIAIEIGATPEQQIKITALFVAVAKDVKPMRGQMQDSARKVRDLLLAEKIDREALEKLRAARLTDAERVSKTIVNAITEAAEVLSFDQRKVLEERIQQFRSMRRGRGRGRPRRGRLRRCDRRRAALRQPAGRARREQCGRRLRLSEHRFRAR